VKHLEGMGGDPLDVLACADADGQLLRGLAFVSGG
jgi:hypothetical protein